LRECHQFEFAEMREQRLVEKGGFVFAGSDAGVVQFVAVEGGAVGILEVVGLREVNHLKHRAQI